MYNSKKYFSFKNANFSEEAVLQTSWALQSVNLPGENYNNDANGAIRIPSHIRYISING